MNARSHLVNNKEVCCNECDLSQYARNLESQLAKDRFHYEIVEHQIERLTQQMHNLDLKCGEIAHLTLTRLHGLGSAIQHMSGVVVKLEEYILDGTQGCEVFHDDEEATLPTGVHGDLEAQKPHDPVIHNMKGNGPYQIQVLEKIKIEETDANGPRTVFERVKGVNEDKVFDKVKDEILKEAQISSQGEDFTMAADGTDEVYEDIRRNVLDIINEGEVMDFDSTDDFLKKFKEEDPEVFEEAKPKGAEEVEADHAKEAEDGESNSAPPLTPDTLN